MQPPRCWILQTFRIRDKQRRLQRARSLLRTPRATETLSLRFHFAFRSFLRHHNQQPTRHCNAFTWLSLRFHFVFALPDEHTSSAKRGVTAVLLRQCVKPPAHNRCFSLRAERPTMEAIDGASVATTPGCSVRIANSCFPLMQNAGSTCAICVSLIARPVWRGGAAGTVLDAAEVWDPQ